VSAGSGDGKKARGRDEDVACDPAVQAAVALIGRSGDASETEGLDLRGLDLRGAQLPEARLRGVILDHARLDGANLYRAKLNDARLWSASLSRANLWETSLEGADLWMAKLDGAALVRTSLDEATVFSPSVLRGAGMKDFDLSRSTVDAPLEEAFGDGSVRLPPGLHAGLPPLEHWAMEPLDYSDFHASWRAWQNRSGSSAARRGGATDRS
jgi:uncharacterized protein YjbI with pentapeptide repeats